MQTADAIRTGRTRTGRKQTAQKLRDSRMKDTESEGEMTHHMLVLLRHRSCGYGTAQRGGSVSDCGGDVMTPGRGRRRQRRQCATLAAAVVIFYSRSSADPVREPLSAACEAAAASSADGVGVEDRRRALLHSVYHAPLPPATTTQPTRYLLIYDITPPSSSLHTLYRASSFPIREVVT